MTDETEYCIVCGDEHPPGLVREHERAAAEYERRYGVAI